jgi:L-lactate dehydrogenase
VAWSNATIGGAPIEKALHSRGLHRKDLEEISKHEEQHTIERKGAIGFGIASVVSGICASVLLNKQDVTPISHFQAELGCCLSLPVILGRKGIVKSVTLQLSSDEKAKLESSAKSLRTMADRIRDDIFSDPY